MNRYSYSYRVILFNSNILIGEQVSAIWPLTPYLLLLKNLIGSARICGHFIGVPGGGQLLHLFAPY